MLLAQTLRRIVGIPHLRARFSLSAARPCIALVIALGVLLWTVQAPRAAAPQFFTATLTGGQQVPAVASSGTGSGTVLLNATEDQITVNMSFSGLTSTAILAHIHGPGAAGTNAGILFDFAAVVPSATAGTIPQQTFSITPAQVAELKAGLYYFNIHTNNFPGGEIRGQIGLAAVQFTTTLTGAQQVPPVASAGTGTGMVALNATEDLLFVNLSFSGLNTPAILAHIHGPGATGTNAGILFDFASFVPHATSGAIPQQTFSITPTQVAELKAGLYYFNVHSESSPGGEIRGQIGFPTMSLDRTSLQFAATNSGASFVQQTLPQTVRILQTGVGNVTWTATPNQPWITVTPTSGTGSATLTVSVTFAPGLPVSGASSGAIALAVTNALNTPGPIAVGLTTIANGASAPPLGLMETPTDGSTGVTGSIAVTGWALDDIEVRAVRIVRDPVAGEGSNLIFIGNAVFIDGARPDVAGQFPSSPRNTRAGWGYMLLTNFLPNLGNGTFRLHALADDAEGHTVDLGTKTITCDNANATRPFGAIDTPAQGEVISGSAYPNFGWVLARTPARAFPPHGTVQLLIDGFFGVAPVGWVSRSDLTAVFPESTYPGVANALGLTSLDTTAMSNGVHTIAWIVTADNGQTDGVGSRYFTVANGQSAGSTAGVAMEPPMVAMRAATGALSLRDAVNAAPLDRAPLAARRGYDMTAPFTVVGVAANGRATVQAEEMDRIEAQLGAASGHEYGGYMRVGNELAPLPIGSHLDRTTGIFTWQPGVGFVHAYDLVFVRWANGQAVARRELRIVLNPKSSNRVGAQVVIDLPAAQETVVQPFIVAGWAVDANDQAGTGIDTLHVWAYPVGGGNPIFVGVAAYGGARPDVAALVGARFRASGYGVTVDGLPPNTYDLAVFAWSTVENRFLPARVVRVAVR